MDTVVAAFGAVLAAVLLLSGVGKLTSLPRADQSIQALRLQRWVARPRWAVVGIVVVELALAIGLLTLNGVAYLWVLAATWSLMVAFGVLALRASRLGSREECGCFGDILPSTVGVALTRRNGVLAAFASVALVTAVVLSATGGVPSVLGGSFDSLPTVIVAWAGLGCGVAIAAVSSRPPATGAASAHAGTMVAPRGAVLLAPDGNVVDPVQRALRGRGQLLLFVRPGCASCDAVRAALSSASPGSVEARVVTAAGDGVDLWRDGGIAEATNLHIDFAGHLARQLGVPESRPAAVLLTIEGQVLRPFAEGCAQVLDLIAAVHAASPHV